jgi:hypothetical protein
MEMNDGVKVNFAYQQRQGGAEDGFNIGDEPIKLSVEEQHYYWLGSQRDCA